MERAWTRRGDAILEGAVRSGPSRSLVRRALFLPQSSTSHNSARTPRMRIGTRRLRSLSPGSEAKVEHFVPGLKLRQIEVSQSGVLDCSAQVKAEVITWHGHRRYRDTFELDSFIRLRLKESWNDVLALIKRSYIGKPVHRIAKCTRFRCGPNRACQRGLEYGF